MRQASIVKETALLAREFLKSEIIIYDMALGSPSMSHCNGIVEKEKQKGVEDDENDNDPQEITVYNNNSNNNHQYNTISSSSLMPPLPLCRVDRYWLQKLILQFHHHQHHHDSNDKRMVDLLSQIKIYASAPMVDQSDLPFRLLCRRYGTNLCFTPMIHAKMFFHNDKYRKKFKPLVVLPADRPLIAQLCGDDPEIMFQCALQIQDFCDGIDINCGCPQGIAKRGNYGAFLLEQEYTLLNLVRYMAPRLKVPLSVKVRLLPSSNNIEESLNLYGRLMDAGIHLLTIHGRTRLQKGRLTGASDWKAIGEAVQRFSHHIPILANGSLASVQDVQDCLQVTQADGVMSAEAILEYPPIFAPIQDPTSQKRVGRLILAREYLELAKSYPPNKGGQGSGFKCIRIHMHRFLHADLQIFTDIRDAIVQAQNVTDLDHAITQLEHHHARLHHNTQEEELSWYVRHRNNNNHNNSNNNCHHNEDENEDDHTDHDTEMEEEVGNQNTLAASAKEPELEDDENDMFGGLF